MVNISDWPDIELIRIRREPSARWSGCVDVEPIFSRSPYADWCLMFHNNCEASLDWKGAGFLRVCGGDVEAAQAQLREMTRLANLQFRDFLARASLNQPVEVGELIALEGSLAVSDNEPGALCNW